MSKVIPFPALIPAKGLERRIACPPYDVLTSEEARKLAEGNPYSLLHVTKPEIDLPPETGEYEGAVYEKGLDNLKRFIEEGTLVRDKATFYIYRLISGDHVQTGVVAGVSAVEYGEGLIRKHEKTREPKVVDRTRLAKATGAPAEPVLLVHKRDRRLAEIVARVTGGKPLFEVTDGDGVCHMLWRAEETNAIISAFSGMDALYIADGHHRSETGFRTYQELRAESPDEPETEAYCFFPAAIFPDDEVKIYRYDWDGPAEERPLADVTMADVMKLADEGGIMPPKSTWFAPKLASGLFVYTF